MKSFDRAFIRYLLTGALNTGLTYLLYLLILAVAPYQVAYTVAYVSGIFTSYIFNSLFVFREALDWKKAIKYPLVYVVQYLIGLIVLSALVEALSIEPSIAALLNIIVTIPITFILSRAIIQPKDKKQSVEM